MIISRTLARKRIALCVRPSWFEAWGPVMADAVLFFAIAGFSAPYIVGELAASQGAWVYAALFAIYFIPMQIVLIVSAMWAARSRWHDDD
tara:strand:+ start:3707 stop:3976 length:270 start_codon:yes stop_codon:yes gene_type:complete